MKSFKKNTCVLESVNSSYSFDTCFCHEEKYRNSRNYSIRYAAEISAWSTAVPSGEVFIRLGY